MPDELPGQIPAPPQPPPGEPPPPPEPEPELSLAEHRAKFSPEAQRAAADAPPDGDQPPHPPHHSTQQRRDGASGEFRDGKKRTRAARAEASPDDVPRIRELTRQLRERDEELARLRQPVAPAAPPQTSVSGHSNGNGNGQQPPPEPRQSQAPTPMHRLPPDPRDPEPQFADPKFGGDYGRFLMDHTRWTARDEWRNQQYAAQQYAQQQAAEQAEHASARAWADRVDKAIAKYPDYEQVAFGPTPIQKNTVAYALIDQHDNGADLLYYLQSHPTERDAILRMPEAQQVVHLSQILLRFASTGGQQFGVTGSNAPPQTIVLPPKPPNPVRTEAQRSGNSTTPPPTDGSMSLAEHRKHFGSRR